MDVARRAVIFGQLAAIAHHDPKKLPKSADELLGRRKALMTKEQWERTLAAALGG